MRVPGACGACQVQELCIQQMVMNTSLPGTGLRAGTTAVDTAPMTYLCVGSAPLIASLRGQPREDLDYYLILQMGKQKHREVL